MLCAVYKSSKKDETYLYLPKRDDFSRVPEPLMTSFGKATLVMMMQFKDDTKMAIADPEKVKSEIKEKGFYLQIPPPKENLLDSFKAQNKKEQSK